MRLVGSFRRVKKGRAGKSKNHETMPAGPSSLAAELVNEVVARHSFSAKRCDQQSDSNRRRVRSTEKRQGFFFLPRRPPRALTASVGVCGAALAPAAVAPPAQPSCDLSMPAARPPTSGINFGSAVVPWIMKGTLVV